METTCVDEKILAQIFPSLALMQISYTKTLQNLKLTLDKEELLLSDLYYLPMMLQHDDLQIAEVAQVEWIMHDLQHQEEINYQLEPGILFVPSDLRLIKLKFDLPQYHLSDGLWVFRKITAQNISRKQLGPVHAEIFDALSEDRKFTERQLLDQLVLKEEVVLDLSLVAEYKQALTELLKDRLILKL